MLKQITKILLAWSAIACAVIIALEANWFYIFTNAFPLSAQHFFDKELLILPQYSKKSATPKDYIAIFGDSYAYGQGDWFYNSLSKIKPTYQTTHLLHEKTGRDVVSFGHQAASSVIGMIETPISGLKYINSLCCYKTDDPKTILIFFYEGNDYYDNLKEFRFRYKANGWEQNKLNDEAYFSQFIEQQILNNNPIYLKSDTHSSFENLIFSKVAATLAYNAVLDIKRGAFDFERKHASHFKKNNEITVNGEKIPVYEGLGAAPVYLRPDQIETALTIFKQSLMYAHKRFPDAKMALIYIPAPTSIYEFLKEDVDIGEKITQATYKANKIKALSQEMCNRIKDITIKENISFVDFSAEARLSAQKNVLHGPVDWEHLNETGYRLLAEKLLAVLPDIEKNGVTENCLSTENNLPTYGTTNAKP